MLLLSYSLLSTAHKLSTVPSSSPWNRLLTPNNDSVRNAQTTVDVTSTLTVISHPPATIVVTSTESVIFTQTAPAPTIAQPQPQPDPEDPNSAQPSNEEDPQTQKHRKRLSKHAIAGLATGSAILGLLLTALVVLSMRRRFRYLHETGGQAQDDDQGVVGGGYDYYAPKQNPSRNDDDGSVSTYLPAPAPAPPSPPPVPGPLRLKQPTLPSVLPHFGPVYPSHHAADFQPPAHVVSGAYSQGLIMAGGNNSTAVGVGASELEGSQYGRTSHSHTHHPENYIHGQSQSQHQRNDSGCTTLVGEPSSPTSLDPISSDDKATQLGVGIAY